MPRNPVHAIRRGRSAFTLIEMLVVIVIIAILAGLVFSLSGLMGDRSDRAKTVKQVEMLANAIEEFRAEYGKYPPVQPYNEGDQDLASIDDALQPIYYEWAVRRYPDSGEPVWVNGLSRAKALELFQSTSTDDWRKPQAISRLYTFGLASFLVTRYLGGDDPYPGLASKTDFPRGHAKASHDEMTDPSQTQKNQQWFGFNVQREDIERDVRACKRFEYYVNAANKDYDWVGRYWSPPTDDDQPADYVNRILTFRDAWHRDLRYESKAPYDSYRLWSKGPDGLDNTSDDIVAGREGQ